MTPTNATMFGHPRVGRVRQRPAPCPGQDCTDEQGPGGAPQAEQVALGDHRERTTGSQPAPAQPGRGGGHVEPGRPQVAREHRTADRHGPRRLGAQADVVQGAQRTCLTQHRSGTPLAGRPGPHLAPQPRTGEAEPDQQPAEAGR